MRKGPRGARNPSAKTSLFDSKNSQKTNSNSNLDYRRQLGRHESRQALLQGKEMQTASENKNNLFARLFYDNVCFFQKIAPGLKITGNIAAVILAATSFSVSLYTILILPYVKANPELALSNSEKNANIRTSMLYSCFIAAPLSYSMVIAYLRLTKKAPNQESQQPWYYDNNNHLVFFCRSVAFNLLGTSLANINSSVVDEYFWWKFGGSISLALFNLLSFNTTRGIGPGNFNIRGQDWVGKFFRNIVLCWVPDDAKEEWLQMLDRPVYWVRKGLDIIATTLGTAGAIGGILVGIQDFEPNPDVQAKPPTDIVLFLYIACALLGLCRAAGNLATENSASLNSKTKALFKGMSIFGSVTISSAMTYSEVLRFLANVFVMKEMPDNNFFPTQQLQIIALTSAMLPALFNGSITYATMKKLIKERVQKILNPPSGNIQESPKKPLISSDKGNNGDEVRIDIPPNTDQDPAFQGASSTFTPV